MTFCDDLFRQQEIQKAMRLRKLIQHPCYDRELDLREMLDLEMVEVRTVAVQYPISLN
jgi:hypothetical protein